MADTLNLLPCPFCGGEAVLVEHQSHAHSAMLKALVPGITDHPGSWSIECCDVGMIKATRAEVVTAWNSRATLSGRPNIATWQQRMPAPRTAYQCSMNCSSIGMGAVREEGCGDCMPITIHGDAVAARDAEIADLRTTLAKSVRHECQSTLDAWAPCQLRTIEAYRALQPPRADLAADSLLTALEGEIPLIEPVYIGKALRAGREARAVLSGGTGPLACAMLVNIQLSPWIYTEDTAKAFADGYNRALDHLRAAVLEVVDSDSATAKGAGGL